MRMHRCHVTMAVIPKILALSPHIVSVHSIVSNHSLYPLQCMISLQIPPGDVSVLDGHDQTGRVHQYDVSDLWA